MAVSGGDQGGPGAPDEPVTDIDLDALLRSVDIKEEKLQSQEQDIARYSTKRETDDRSFIAKLIVVAFVLSIGVFILFVGAIGISGACDAACGDRWKDAAAQITEILKSVLLPVVTLVLGFYFGRQAGAAQGDK